MSKQLSILGNVCWVRSGVQVGKACRSRKIQRSKYLVRNIGFDTAKDTPSKGVFFKVRGSHARKWGFGQVFNVTRGWHTLCKMRYYVLRIWERHFCYHGFITTLWEIQLHLTCYLEYASISFKNIRPHYSLTSWYWFNENILKLAGSRVRKVSLWKYRSRENNLLGPYVVILTPVPWISL